MNKLYEKKDADYFFVETINDLDEYLKNKYDFYLKITSKRFKFGNDISYRLIIDINESLFILKLFDNFRREDLEQEIFIFLTGFPNLDIKAKFNFIK